MPILTVGCTEDGSTRAVNATPEDASTASADTAPPGTRGEVGVVHQSAPFARVLASEWDGTTPFGAVRSWGDFGVGGFDHFRGEIVMDGEPYVIESDGVPRVPGDAETAVYVVVTKFASTATHSIDAPTGCVALTSTVLPALLPRADGMYAIRIRGRLSWAQARSYIGWDPPYPSALVLVGDGQVLFDLRDVTGSIVAYYLPPAADSFCSLGTGCAQAGFHLHYVNDDRQAGGHLLDCTVEAATVEIGALRELRLHMPDGTEESLASPP